MTDNKVSLEVFHEIQQLLGDYAWSYDSRDFVAMSKTFSPDGTLLMLGESYQGRDIILKHIQDHVNKTHLDKSMQHHISHLKIFRQDNEYRAYSYWIVTGRLTVDKSCFIGAQGWYEDIIEKTDDQWFFKQRRLLQGMPDGLPWT